MRHTSIPVALITTFAFACTAQSSEQPTDSQEPAAITVTPTAGTAPFTIATPEWSTQGFYGRYSFLQKAIAVGETKDFPVLGGQVSLRYDGFRDGFIDPQVVPERIELKAGVARAFRPSGVRVRFSEPLTLGGVQVKFHGQFHNRNSELAAAGAWRKLAGGVGFFAAPGNFRWLAMNDAQNDHNILITEGQLLDVALPTARIELQFEAFDPRYPSVKSSSCAAPTISTQSGFSDATDTPTLRNLDGSPVATQYVVPHTALASAMLNIYGMKTPVLTTANGRQVVRLSRLQVDDVDVTTGAGVSKVPGTFRVRMKNSTLLDCNFPTHTGLDLPTGTYEITSEANTANGVVRSTQEVSIP
jgi:hypothetical protein